MPDESPFPPVVAALLAVPRVPPLGPGTPDPAAATVLRALDPLTAFGPVADPDAARACLAGLWLLFDHLDESHAISQELHTPEGSAWHAVMHRREPDAFNSKYWWRKVGPHPVFRELADAAADLRPLGMGPAWEPARFVDLCERHRGTGTAAEDTLKRAARREWDVMFGWCLRTATASQR